MWWPIGLALFVLWALATIGAAIIYCGLDMED